MQQKSGFLRPSLMSRLSQNLSFYSVVTIFENKDSFQQQDIKRRSVVISLSCNLGIQVGNHRRVSESWMDEQMRQQDNADAAFDEDQLFM